MRTAHMVSRHFPGLPIYARARNRYHAHLLMDLGVKVVTRETFLSSLDMGGRVLRGLGYEEAEVAFALEAFRRHDEETLAHQQAIFRDRAKLIQNSREAAEELEQLFEADTGDSQPVHSRGGLRLDHGRTATVPETDDKDRDP
jgi:glutathione-regulated potassium-efflux system ancillary protein KefC/glutathione-regulated potassium-efflux system protein KefB